MKIYVLVFMIILLYSICSMKFIDYLVQILVDGIKLNYLFQIE